jgi:hypothetical protein
MKNILGILLMPIWIILLILLCIAIDIKALYMSFKNS